MTPSYISIATLVGLLFVLASRLSLETTKTARDHFVIASGALFGFTAVYRLVDILHHMDETRWSSVLVWVGALAFLIASKNQADKVARLLAELAARKEQGQTE